VRAARDEVATPASRPLMWRRHGGGGIVGEEGPGGEEEDSENGRGNLIMRHLTVRGSPFRANPAKWRGWRQPNNQAVN